MGDMLGWLLPIPTALGLYGVERAQLYGLDDPWIWVIGGAEIFAAAMARADRLEVTELNASFAGDTVAPGLDASWRLVASDPTSGWHCSRGGLEYRFLRYER